MNHLSSNQVRLERISTLSRSHEVNRRDFFFQFSFCSFLFFFLAEQLPGGKEGSRFCKRRREKDRQMFYYQITHKALFSLSNLESQVGHTAEPSVPLFTALRLVNHPSITLPSLYLQCTCEYTLYI